MQAFLEVQKATMLAYLSGRGSPAAGRAPMGTDGHDVGLREHEPSRRRWSRCRRGQCRPAIAPDSAESGEQRPARRRGHVKRRTRRFTPEREAATLTATSSTVGPWSRPRRARIGRRSRPAARDRPRSDGLPDRDPGARPRYGGRPGDRLDQAGRDPGETARRVSRIEGPVGFRRR